MDVDELAPDMGQAGNFADGPGSVELAVAGIGIGVYPAGERREVPLRVDQRGLSGILCGGRFHLADPEPFAEGDGELRPGLDPLPRRPFPISGGAVEDEV